MTHAKRMCGVALCLAAVAMAGTAADSSAVATAAPPRSPFGIGSCHINGVSQEGNARWVPQMVSIGVTDMRAIGTGWGAVEPQPGQWTWAALDKQMDYLDGQGMRYGGLLLGNPKWNVQDARGSLPVRNIAGWSNYVGQIVRHCKGRIKYWEVWNEPPNGTGRDQTAADYAKIVMAAYDAAKAADPACQVGMAAKSVAINYLDQAVAAGARGHFDYITLHPYEVGGCVIAHPGSEVVFLQIAPTLRKMLARRDPARVDCPIVFTELGFAAGGKYSRRIGMFSAPEVQAQALVKYYTMGIAQGIACIQWFEGRDGDSGPMGLIDGQGNPRPAFQALAGMVKVFGAHPAYLGWILLNDRHYAFAFEGAQGPLLATWSATLAGDTIDFGAQVEVVDAVTGKRTSSTSVPLGIAPVFVSGVPEALLKQARANKARPFPWGGDYTGARTVSVTCGERNVEKGLHTQSAESIASDVVAYGGSARVGTVPGGNVFMVDPNFLAYDTVPIEISAVVRRNEANAPATLKLNYESTSGYRDAAAYEIPDNTQWHTATWRIEDAQFVSQWAYNFRFNAGPYCVQSVSVTRLAK